MSNSDEEFAEYKRAAQDMGATAGRAVATWVFDGNTSESTYEECVRLDNDGDPAWYDHFGARAPLSGEWADEPTPAALAEALGVEPDSDDMGDLCSAYEDAYYAAYHEEVMRMAYDHIGGA